MGASGWSYFVPYEADVSAALQRLREGVFARGDYLYGSGITEAERKAAMKDFGPHVETWISNLIKESEDPNLSELERAISKAGAEQIRKKLSAMKEPLQRRKKPKSIGELLEMQSESGTHSILDIASISPKPTFGAISPFPPSKVLEFFATETPSHAQIEEAYGSGSLEEYLSDRWKGIYITTYRDSEPEEFFFAGCSGD